LFRQRVWFTTSMLADACAVNAGEPVAVAVMVQSAPAAGAVYTPTLETEPHEALHVTTWLAVKVCVFSACRLALDGVRVMGEFTVTFVEAVAPLALVEVAVTWHVAGTSGAVYRPPLAVIEPHAAVNVAGELAVNCWVTFSINVGVSGDRVNCGAAPIVS